MRTLAGVCAFQTVDAAGTRGEAGRGSRRKGIKTVTLLVVFIIAALIFGIGGLVKGLLWATLIGIVLLVAAVWWGWRTLTADRNT